MSHDGERRPIGVVQPEAVGADVAGDRRRPARGHRVEAVAAELAAQPVECVVLEDLPADPLVDARALARSDQQHEPAVGHAAQQPLDQRRADETRAPGDGDALARQLLGDHRRRF